jgi:2-hydroxy-3-oxopropionate reductase
VGVIGLGTMGLPMAKNILAAGFSLIAHNRSREPVEQLVALGATAASSPRELASSSDIVITVLPDAPDVDRVVRGEDGVGEGIRSGSMLIDMTTSSPSLARDLAHHFKDRDVAVLDAPVSGGETGAISGELSIMVGGDDAAYQRALPVLSAMGKTIVLIGGPGAGQVTKAANQMVVAITIAGVSEALLLAKRAGVDPRRVRQALLGGFAQSRILDLHGGRILAKDYQPGFRSALQQKDLRIAAETASAVASSAPTTDLVLDLYGKLVACGMGDLDHSALAEFLEEAS